MNVAVVSVELNDASDLSWSEVFLDVHGLMKGIFRKDFLTVDIVSANPLEVKWKFDIFNYFQ